MTRGANGPEHSLEAAGTMLMPLEDQERWWGGRVADALAMPYGTADFTRDLAGAEPVSGRTAGASNQASPLLISTTGPRLQADGPLRFRFTAGELEVTGVDVRLQGHGTSLRSVLPGAVVTETAEGPDLDAAPAACSTHRRGTIRAGGPVPDRSLFTGPQYSSWIEQPYLPTQDGVLACVRRLLDAGMPPGADDDRGGCPVGGPASPTPLPRASRSRSRRTSSRSAARCRRGRGWCRGSGGRACTGSLGTIVARESSRTGHCGVNARRLSVYVKHVSAVSLNRDRPRAAQGRMRLANSK